MLSKERYVRGADHRNTGERGPSDVSGPSTDSWQHRHPSGWSDLQICHLSRDLSWGCTALLGKKFS